jgi:hypothetical protein
MEAEQIVDEANRPTHDCLHLDNIIRVMHYATERMKALYILSVAHKQPKDHCEDLFPMGQDEFLT